MNQSRDNNTLHAEPFLGRASMLCFLYGPGEPGRYAAKTNGKPKTYNLPVAGDELALPRLLSPSAFG